MSPEAQRKALCDQCGWVKVPPSITLDVIHAAEGRLTKLQKSDYGEFLDEMCDCYEDAICAPAEKKLEAIVKAFGLWEDSK